VASGVRVVTQQIRIVVAVLVVAVLLLMIAIAGEGDLGSGPSNPLGGKAERATTHEDGRGVSQSTATLLAGGLALLGVVVGLFGDRYFRYRGDILCRSSDWSMTCTLRAYQVHEAPYEAPLTRELIADEDVMTRAKYGNYSVSVKLFNETEVATGLRDIRVAFTDDSGATERVYEPQMIEGRGLLSESDVLNLPARQWVSVKLEGRVETEDFEVLARSTTVEMRAWLPKDKPFERLIARLWD
jgi:hypothetical protein